MRVWSNNNNTWIVTWCVCVCLSVQLCHCQFGLNVSRMLTTCTQQQLYEAAPCCSIERWHFSYRPASSCYICNMTYFATCLRWTDEPKQKSVILSINFRLQKFQSQFTVEDIAISGHVINQCHCHRGYRMLQKIRKVPCVSNDGFHSGVVPDSRIKTSTLAWLNVVLLSSQLTLVQKSWRQSFH